jgi:hypothetical protein
MAQWPTKEMPTEVAELDKPDHRRVRLRAVRLWQPLHHAGVVHRIYTALDKPAVSPRRPVTYSRWRADSVVAASAEAGREFDKLATYLTTPSRLAYPGSELGSQPQPDAPVNYISQPEPSVTQLRQVFAIGISVSRAARPIRTHQRLIYCLARAPPLLNCGLDHIARAGFAVDSCQPPINFCHRN